MNSETFAGLINLKLLRIRYSIDFEIPTDMFKYLVNLTELDISNNKLKALDPELFSYLPKLETLDLSCIRGYLCPHEFIHLKELKTLKLHRNQIKKFREESLRKFFKLTIFN